MRSGPRWQSSLRRTRTPPSSSALDGQSGRLNTQSQGTIGQVKAGAQDTRGIAVDSAVGPLKWRQCTRTDPVRRVLSALSAGDPPGCAPARHILVLVMTVDKWITSSLETPDVLVFLASARAPSTPGEGGQGRRPSVMPTRYWRTAGSRPGGSVGDPSRCHSGARLRTHTQPLQLSIVELAHARKDFVKRFPDRRREKVGQRPAVTPPDVGSAPRTRWATCLSGFCSKGLPHGGWPGGGRATLVSSNAAANGHATAGRDGPTIMVAAVVVPARDISGSCRNRLRVQPAPWTRSSQP